MKRYFPLLMLVIGLSPLSAVQPGDSLDQVIAEKGKPLSRAEGGTMVILNYSDCSVQIRDNQVVAIKTKSQAQGPITHTAPVATAAPKPKMAGPADEESERGDWTTDVRAAISQAQAQKKHIFLFFTGSDWCGWCKRLNHEILSTDEFQRYASDKLVLVKLDFPRYHPIPEDVKAQNEQLASHFKIRGYPTVIVLDGSGKPLGELGYQEGGPGPFVQALQHL